MNIGYLGDSITLGYGLEHRERDRFSRLLTDRYGWEERNYGITGTLVARAGLSASDGTAYVDRYECLRGTEFAVIFGGTNDYFWTDQPISPENDAGDERSFTVALESILRGVREFLPASRILVVTPYPHRGIGNFSGGRDFRDASEHDTDTPNFVGNTLSDYCDAIADVCGANGISVLDLRKVSVPFDWRALTSDGCHPNPDGHRWLAEQIGGKIREML